MAPHSRDERIDALIGQVAALVERLQDYPELKRTVSETKAEVEGWKNRFWGFVIGAGTGGGGIGALVTRLLHG